MKKLNYFRISILFISILFLFSGDGKLSEEAVVDRIEGDIVICETETRKIIGISERFFVSEVSEGDQITIFEGIGIKVSKGNFETWKRKVIKEFWVN